MRRSLSAATISYFVFLMIHLWIEHLRVIKYRFILQFSQCILYNNYTPLPNFIRVSWLQSIITKEFDLKRLPFLSHLPKSPSTHTYTQTGFIKSTDNRPTDQPTTDHLLTDLPTTDATDKILFQRIDNREIFILQKTNTPVKLYIGLLSFPWINIFVILNVFEENYFSIKDIRRI